LKDYKVFIKNRKKIYRREKMRKNFNYNDEVWYEDVDGNIQNALFSHHELYYWVSYKNKEKENIRIETKKLFDTKINLLLYIFKEKKKYIEGHERLIEKFNRQYLCLYDELLELEVEIEKENNGK